MATIRIIPRLDIKGPNLVKGVNLEGLRVMGKPEKFAFTYYNEWADELLYVDIVASLYGRNNLTEVVKRTAENVYIPLTVGGGIRTVEDVKNILRAGADKVAINTGAIRNPQFVKEAAEVFGSQCIVVSIEAKKMLDGKYLAFTDNGREPTGVEVFGWAKKAYELGAGEILITSIDREGTGNGYDLELVKRIAESVPIPVIACGGAGNPSNVRDVILKGKADAVCASSIFHYDIISRGRTDAESEEYTEGVTDFLKGKRESSMKYKGDRIAQTSIPDLKKFLTESGINCRTIN